MRAAHVIVVAAAALAGVAAAATAAAPLPTLPGTLYGLGVLSVADDDHATGGVLVVNATTGHVAVGHEFPFPATDQSSLYCFIGWRAAPRPTYYATAGSGPDLVTVDAATGAVTTRVPLSPPAYVTGFAYDEARGAGVAVLRNPTTGKGSLGLVNTTTGVWGAVNASFPWVNALPCEQRLVPSHGWAITLSADGDRDDADDTFVVASYADGGATVYTGPWRFASGGRINAFTELPLAVGALATRGVLAAAKHDSAVWGALVWVNFTAPGADDPVTLVDFAAAFPGTPYTDVTMTLGCVTVALVPGGGGGGGDAPDMLVYVLARDMGSETALLLTAGLRVGAAGALEAAGAPVLMVLDEAGVGGDAYGLRWAPA
jgi:hypothetical protein